MLFLQLSYTLIIELAYIRPDFFLTFFSSFLLIFLKNIQVERVQNGPWKERKGEDLASLCIREPGLQLKHRGEQAS